MNKVLNFLFPGDVIKIKANESVKEFLNIEEDPILSISIVSYFYRKDQFEAIAHIYKISVTSSLVFKCIHEFNTNFIFHIIISGRSFEISINDIELVSREKYVTELSTRNYCIDYCILRKRGLCNGLDNSCEFNESNYIPLIGDIVEIDGIKRGLVYGMFEDVSSSEFPVYNISDLSSPNSISFLINKKEEIKLLEKNSTIITPGACNMCIANNCDNCELKKLKDLNIK